MTATSSPLDLHREYIEDLFEEGLGNTEIASLVGTRTGNLTSEASIRRAIKRWGLSRPGDGASTVVEGDKAEIDTGTIAYNADHYELMRERGLDPAEWHVDGLRVTSWDGPGGIPLKALKINLRRIKPLDMVFPAREPGSYRNITKPRKPLKGEPRVVVFVGDQQAPYHHLGLHDAFCQFLEDVQPHEGVLIGDTMDFPKISRHPLEPEWAATTQECINAAHALLCDYVQASEGTSWKKLAGNHDERLRRSIIDKVGDLHELCQAEGDVSVFSPSHLLRLDELGIEYVEPKGGYNAAQVKVSDHLAARHGWIARKGSGASALATLEHLGYSVVVGHTHRQSLIHKTRHDIHGDLSTLAAVETGCMCLIREGLGYAVAPDWQNGFATAAVWPDGTFKLDLATFVNDVLFWRDKRYG